MNPPVPYDLSADRRALALVRAVLADPRNPHLLPALIDYFQRAELPRYARLLAGSGDAVAAVARLFDLTAEAAGGIQRISELFATSTGIPHPSRTAARATAPRIPLARRPTAAKVRAAAARPGSPLTRGSGGLAFGQRRRWSSPRNRRPYAADN